MDKLFQDRSGEKREHPAHEMLMLFVDGELMSKESVQLETHLEACWPCRVKTKNIQEAIADIIEFDETVLTPSLLPPNDWRNFDRQLRQLAVQSGSQSLLAKFMGSLGRFLPAVRFMVRGSRQESPVRDEMFIDPGRPSIPSSPFRGDVSLLKEREMRWGSWAINMPPLRSWFLGTPLRFTATVLAVALVVTLALLSNHGPVSASELLHQAVAARAAKLRATAQPVIHQRLEVRRKDQTREQTANWELWDDTVNGRFRELTGDDTETRRLGDTANSSLSPPPRVAASPRPSEERELLTDLVRVLVANHMDPRRPLSAASYQSWHDTLQHQQDEVSRTKLSGNVEALTLHTTAAPPLSAGQIAEAVFVVRAQDWQPISLRLTVEADGGRRVYELTETVSEIVSLTQIDPKIFEGTVASNSTSTAKSESRNPELETPNSKLETVSSPTASADLEVEALRLLNQAGADLGEQISVKRLGDGLLHINGMVETDQRKAEIVNALGPIAGNPAVRIEVQTVAEAVAAQRHTKPTPLPSQRAFQISGNTMAAEPELRAYFEGRSRDTDEAVRQYAARMVSLSNRGMDHLWAMKRLLSQFSPEEMRALTPEARAKWLSLIRAHARSYQQSNETLRRELQPVFFPAKSPALSNESAITDTNELARAIEQLFESGSANDRVIRSAFTSSTSGARTTVIKAPQFWQSLKNAEGLAARIGAVARP